MNPEIQRQLDLLEFSLNAANSKNHHYLSGAMRARLAAMTHFVGADALARPALERLEDCGAGFIAALSASGQHETRLDAIRADALAALSGLRSLLANGGVGAAI